VRLARTVGARLKGAGVAAAVAVGPIGAFVPTAPGGQPAPQAERVALPSPVPSWIASFADDGPAGAGTKIAFRLYLAGRSPTRELDLATAVSSPTNGAYRDYLSPAEFQSRFGPSTTQLDAVESWARKQALRVTGSTPHYVSLAGTAPAVSAALRTSIHRFGNHAEGVTGYAPVKGASLPTAIAADVSTVVGLDSYQFVSEAANPPHRFATRTPLTVTAPTATYPCSSWWGEHLGAIPKAYGRTRAPTAVCGYTPKQLRSAYGVTRASGKGSTIAVVLDGNLTTMKADADRFFASQHVAGFTAGQFQQNLGPGFRDACGSQYADVPEEPLDVETAHIMAPAAKVVYVAVNCSNDTPVFEENFLDAETRIVDDHLADVETDSYSTLESEYTTAMTAAWTKILEQGAIEGIGFDFDSGDGGTAPAVEFPASDPWATAVGGTTLEIGRTGKVAGEVGWGDTAAQENRAGTAYLQTPPGLYEEGTTGGRSVLFAEPSYQRGVVPTALSTDGGKAAAGREVPDVAADASPISGWLIGFTTPGSTYGKVIEGGTSGASPIVASLEADSGALSHHAVGFANPALYTLRRTAAIRDIVTSASPAVAVAPLDGCFNGVSPVQRCLITLGLDGTQLVTKGYDDVTGIGAATNRFAQLLAGVGEQRGRARPGP
jgi:subtilase family serine protease